MIRNLSVLIFVAFVHLVCVFFCIWVKQRTQPHAIQDSHFRNAAKKIRVRFAHSLRLKFTLNFVSYVCRRLFLVNTQTNVMGLSFEPVIKNISVNGRRQSRQRRRRQGGPNTTRTTVCVYCDTLCLQQLCVKIHSRFFSLKKCCC